jgi:hypothetical protein
MAFSTAAHNLPAPPAGHGDVGITKWTRLSHIPNPSAVLRTIARVRANRLDYRPMYMAASTTLLAQDVACVKKEFDNADWYKTGMFRTTIEDVEIADLHIVQSAFHRTKRYLLKLGGLVSTLEISRVMVEEEYRERGYFGRFLCAFEKIATDEKRHVYVESVLNDFMVDMLLKRGYVEESPMTRCYFK